MATPTILTPKKRATFLAALAAGHTIKFAAEAARFNRTGMYEMRENDPAFGVAWDAALEEGTQVLEQEARRRAVDGTEKPVYQGGKLVGVVREYSDVLLIFLLKARRPMVYRDQIKHDVDHHQPDGPSLIEVIYTDAPARLPPATP